MRNSQQGQKEEGAIVKRGSRKEDHDGHSSAWKVAFADFCLALMCLFLVLWLMSASKQEAQEAVIQSSSSGGSLPAEGGGHIVDSLGSPPGSMIERFPVAPGEGGTPAGDSQAKKRYDTPAEMAELQRILVKLVEQDGMRDNLQAVVTPQGLRVMLHDTERQGIFELGSAIPSQRFRGLLRKIGPIFAEIENQMLITGHTDSLPYAGKGHLGFSNWTLSSNRALSARAQLIAGGMPPESVLQVVGMADRAPVDAAYPRGAVNRRIELLILGTSQSQALLAMFGAPTRVLPLIEGVNTVAGESDSIMKVLRLSDRAGSTRAALSM